MKTKCLLFTAVIFTLSTFSTRTVSAAESEKVKKLSSEVFELMKSDLEKLSEITSFNTSSTFKEYFKFEFNGQNLERWFRERVQTVAFSMDPLNIRKKKRSAKISDVNTDDLQCAAVNVSTPKKPRRLIIGPQYLNSNRDWLERLAILIHEARHSDASASNSLKHIKCPDNHPSELLRGTEACDATIEGSYGFELIFLNEIMLNCDTCDEATQDRARELYEKYQDRVLDFTDKRNDI